MRCDSIILKMLQRYLQLQPQLQTRLQPQLQTRVQVLQISIPGRKIPEWFSNQSSGDSLTMELPTTWMGIALCAVFEVQAHLSDFQYFQISCSTQGLLPHGVFSKYFKIGDVVSDHLWSSTTYPTNSVDAQGQHRHDDEEAGPSGSGSSHQKSLFCNTYAFSEEADQDELNDDDVVVDEARPEKEKRS
ncbi:Disease resistance protein TIR-NBS-LRR class family, partial [Prunus dulcis]